MGKFIKLQEQDTEQTLHGLEQRVRELQHELDFVKKELSMAKQEVQLNRVFGSKADVVSEADIKGKAEQLNGCVYQLASMAGDAVENAKLVSSQSLPSKNTAEFFGDSLVKLVMELRPNLTHVSTAISLQACLNHFCHNVLSSEFSFVVDRSGNEILQNIFDNMKASRMSILLC